MASSKRERELARQRAARQAARRSERERRRRRRSAIVASAVAAALVAGAAAATTFATQAGDDDTLTTEPTTAATSDAAPEPTSEPTADATGVPTAATDGECSYPPSGEPARDVDPPDDDVDRQTPYRAVMQTDQGEMRFEMFTADAPCTVHSFRHLAAADFFDDTPCHRLTDRGIFVLQCGDPTGSGTGGPGYSFADENLTDATYERGVVAMANSGPDTNGSQFFLVYADSQLPPQYIPFGRLDDASLAVLDRIAEAGAAEPDERGNTAPNTPVQIEDFRVEPLGG